MLHITHINTNTQTLTLLSLQLLEHELGASNDANGLVPASNSVECFLGCNPTS